MKNLKNWLNRNNFNFEVKESIIGKELIFIKIEGIGSENIKKIKSYLKRYKFNFEYRCNYTYILAHKEEIKADAEAEEIHDRQLEILNKQIKNNVINYCFRTIKEVNYIKAHNYYIANIEYFNNNYDFILTIDDFKKGIKKYKSDCTEQQQKEIFFNTINNLDISVFKKLYNKYKNSNYDIKYQLNSLYLDKYNNTLDIKNITLNDCRLLNYFLEASEIGEVQEEETKKEIKGDVRK